VAEEVAKYFRRYALLLLALSLLFESSVDVFPRECCEDWAIQNWVQVISSAQSPAGKQLSCNETTRWSAALAPKLSGTERFLLVSWPEINDIFPSRFAKGWRYVTIVILIVIVIAGCWSQSLVCLLAGNRAELLRRPVERARFHHSARQHCWHSLYRTQRESSRHLSSTLC